MCHTFWRRRGAAERVQRVRGDRLGLHRPGASRTPPLATAAPR